MSPIIILYLASVFTAIIAGGCFGWHFGYHYPIWKWKRGIAKKMVQSSELPLFTDDFADDAGSGIAPGWNPSGLTNSQVGDGYFLLNLGDFIPATAEWWRCGCGPWVTISKEDMPGFYLDTHNPACRAPAWEAKMPRTRLPHERFMTPDEFRIIHPAPEAPND